MIFRQLEKRALDRVNQVMRVAGAQEWIALPAGIRRHCGECVFSRALGRVAAVEIPSTVVITADLKMAQAMAEAWSRPMVPNSEGAYVVELPFSIWALTVLFDFGWKPSQPSWKGVSLPAAIAGPMMQIKPQSPRTKLDDDVDALIERTDQQFRTFLDGQPSITEVLLSIGPHDGSDDPDPDDPEEPPGREVQQRVLEPV